LISTDSIHLGFLHRIHGPPDVLTAANGCPDIKQAFSVRRLSWTPRSKDVAIKELIMKRFLVASGRRFFCPAMMLSNVASP